MAPESLTSTKHKSDHKVNQPNPTRKPVGKIDQISLKKDIKKPPFVVKHTRNRAMIFTLLRTDMRVGKLLETKVIVF